MESVLSYVKGGIVMGLGLGVARLLGSLPVVEPTEEEQSFNTMFPGIASQRDLMFAFNVLLSYKCYAPEYLDELLRECERVVRFYIRFFRQRTSLSEEELLRAPRTISVMGHDAVAVVDNLAIMLVAARPDMENEISDAAETVRKCMKDLFYNCSQEVETLMDE